MRTALSLRVSTIHPKPDLQADSLRRYALRAGGWRLCSVLDGCHLRSQGGRLQLQALMRAARHHECDGVLVLEVRPVCSQCCLSLKALESSITSGCASSVCRITWTGESDGQAMCTVIGSWPSEHPRFISERVKAAWRLQSTGKTSRASSHPTPLGSHGWKTWPRRQRCVFVRSRMPSQPSHRRTWGNRAAYANGPERYRCDRF